MKQKEWRIEMRKVIVFSLLLISAFVTGCNDSSVDNLPPTNPVPGEPAPISPPTRKDSEHIRADPESDRFEKALERADLFEIIDAHRSNTILSIIAPNNAAFEALYKELGTSEEAFLDRPDLAAILEYHLASTDPENVPLRNGSLLTTLEGGVVSVSVPGGVNEEGEEDIDQTVFNGEAYTVNVDCCGGMVASIIYVVDAVLLPESVE